MSFKRGTTVLSNITLFTALSHQMLLHNVASLVPWQIGCLANRDFCNISQHDLDLLVPGICGLARKVRSLLLVFVVVVVVVFKTGLFVTVTLMHCSHCSHYFAISPCFHLLGKHMIPYQNFIYLQAKTKQNTLRSLPLKINRLLDYR